jgi:hypothetical protein
MNPRDIATDLGKAQDTMVRMILRRGIPFGPPIAGAKKPPPKVVRSERGLMFLCYGATIEDQFELITRRWANSTMQPSFGGHDPVIGAADRRGDRTRFIDFPTPAGPRRITLDRDGSPRRAAATSSPRPSRPSPPSSAREPRLAHREPACAQQDEGPHRLDRHGPGVHRQAAPRRRIEVVERHAAVDDRRPGAERSERHVERCLMLKGCLEAAAAS